LKRVRRQLRCERPTLILRAVQHARSAYEILSRGTDEPKMAYVLNQITYFMSMSGMYKVADVQPSADRLMRYEKRDLWQYRFDDTLAHYYLLWSRQTESYADRVDILKMGLDRVKKARKHAPEDPEIRETFEVINGELLKLRGRRSADAASLG